VSLNRNNPSRDKNEPEIKQRLKDLNCRVWAMSGPGLPDLLCSLGDQFFLVEVKMPGARLTDLQISFFDDCSYDHLPAFVARSVKDVDSIIKGITNEKTTG
jgi:hypothetical protein